MIGRIVLLRVVEQIDVNGMVLSAVYGWMRKAGYPGKELSSIIGKLEYAKNCIGQLVLIPLRLEFPVKFEVDSLDTALQALSDTQRRLRVLTLEVSDIRDRSPREDAAILDDAVTTLEDACVELGDVYARLEAV